VVSKYFTILVLLIAFLTGIYWIYIDKSIALMAFSSVLIVACPCALALSIPFAFGNTIRVLGKKGFYLKNTNVVEQLSKIDTIVFDKTGTITQADSQHVNFVGKEHSPKEYQLVKSITRHSTHPLSTSIYNSIRVDKLFDIEDFREIYTRGIVGKYEQVEIKLGSYEFVFTEKTTEEFSNRVYFSLNKEVLGYFSIENKYRDGLAEILNKLSKTKELYLISGDNNSEKERLLEYFKSPEHINFNQSPEDKLQFVKRLKSQGKNVLMVGDGLNDAGALNESHVGISIADNIYHFSPACDAILEAGEFENLPDLIQFTQKSIKVVYASYFLSISYNLVGLSFAIRGMLTPIIAAILMPASSVSVVAFVSLSVLFFGKKFKQSQGVKLKSKPHI